MDENTFIFQCNCHHLRRGAVSKDVPEFPMPVK